MGCQCPSGNVPFLEPLVLLVTDLSDDGESSMWSFLRTVLICPHLVKGELVALCAPQVVVFP
jgi:hypothetical protein